MIFAEEFGLICACAAPILAVLTIGCIISDFVIPKIRFVNDFVKRLCEYDD